MRIIGKLALVIALMCFTAAPVYAQKYPTGVVKIIVPFGAGGITDLYGRLLADELSKSLNGTVIVENRPGQGGSLGPASVARSAPDGLTLLLVGSANSIGESLFQNLSYSLLKDFAPIGRTATIVNVLLLNPKVSAKNVKELVALTKANPGKMTFGSSGVGSVYHLAMELFKSMSGADLLHIPYRVESASRTAVISGEVDIIVTAYGVAAPAIEAGQVRAIAVTGPARTPEAPTLPTIAESGLPGYDGDAYIGLVAPAGTPRTIIDELNAEIVKIHQKPEFREKLTKAGLTAIDDTPDKFSEFLKSDVAKWKKVIEFAKVKVN
jgi:tripartite-type tricarboxylate transporter receptor subunit TctC